LDELNATFVPDKIGNVNGMQITYLKDGSTRNIFVYTEEGKVRVQEVCTTAVLGFHYKQ
jgi:hypothetical protein